jgi:hypothetical protein
MKINYDDERDLQRKIARKISNDKYTFRIGSSSFFCDVLDDFYNIYIEVKVKDEFAAAQLLYGAVREYGNGSELNFIPQMFGLATPNEISFYKVPNWMILKAFYQKIDSTGKLAPSMVPKSFNAEALQILGQPIHINHYDTPLDFEVPYIFISPTNIFYIMSRLEKYDIEIRELISKISDVYNNKGDISVLKKGGIQDNIDGSIVKSKPIKPVDESFVKALRITPHDLTNLSAHLDEYQKIGDRRKLGKFYTQPKLSDKVADIIRKYVEPSLIVEPYAGTGSLLLPFIGTKMIANDISKEDIEVAKLSFEGQDIKFDTIDVMDYSAEELIKRWEIEPSDNLLVYSNPPFGTSATTRFSDGDLKKGESRKIEIKYRDELLKYGKGDLVLPAIGQQIELIKKLGKGYLAFFSPFDIMCGRKRYNKVLKELLDNFTFLEGEIIKGDEFNSVNKEKPIVLTIWKFCGNTKHINLKFNYNDKEIKLKEGFHLKDGWKYDERDGNLGDLTIAHRETFNVSQPPIFHISPTSGGSKVNKDNVKKDISFSNFPSELIYGLWSTAVGINGMGLNNPFYFNGAYVHMPTDFTIKENQLILSYLIIWNLVNEIAHNYTKGLIGFTDTMKEIIFGTPEQTKAVKDLLEKYKDEPCLDTTIEKVIELMKKEEIDYKALRKDLRERLSKLLNDIGYWDYIIIKPVN